jgi:cytochrome c peroxidase
MSRIIIASLLLLGIASLPACWFSKPVVSDAERVELGRQLFFDKMLSEPDGQACSVCHSPRTAFSDPFNAPISEGMIDGAFVNRNGNSLMYVSFIPPLHQLASGEYNGGLFWDGRSNDLRHQLAGPFFNPAEMNNPDTTALVAEIEFAPWRKLFRRIYGRGLNEEAMYDGLTQALAAFEACATFRPFNSAFDGYLKGTYRMTPEEMKGFELFKGKAACTKCHTIEPQAGSGAILFSDYSYHNLGLPRYEGNPFYTTLPTINPNGHSAIDRGLGQVVQDSNQDGKFRTPSLRNVAVTAPYFHHGGVATLEEAVHFIVARDAMHLPPEVDQNIETEHVGHLPIDAHEERALVAFLRLLTDGYSQEP